MSPPSGTWSWIGSYLARHRGALAMAGLSMGVVAATRALYAALVGPALRLLLDEPGSVFPTWAPALLRDADRRSALALLAALTVVAAAAKAVGWYLQRLLMFRVGLAFVADVRKDLHAHLLRLRPQLLLDARRGDLATRIASDPRQLVHLIDPGLETFARVGITVAVVGAYACWVEPVLGTVALLIWPMLGGLMLWTARRARALEGREASDRGRMAGQVGEVSALIPLVRAYGAEPAAIRLFGAQVDAALRTGEASGRLHARTGPLVEAVAAATAALLLLLAGLGPAPDPADAARLLSFFGACFFIFSPLRGLAYALEAATWSLAAVDRLRALLAMEPEPADPPGSPVARLERELRVQELHCVLGGKPVLRGLSFTVRAGESVAVVGASGAGKSTLAAVLLRFVEPSAGGFALDGLPADQAGRASVRRLFAWVTQEPLLFADRVAANVALGAEPDPVRLARALRGAQAEDFVAALPEGVETRLAEGGAPLSLGQRQRLCIARALYRDAPVLLLDEPTSALDGAAEAEVSATIEALLGTRTVLLISHRLATVRRCARILVLEEGRVVQEGALAEVWTPGSPFARLFGEPPRSEG